MSKNVQASLKRLHSPDILDLDAFYPDDPDCFGFLLQAMFGPTDSQSEESFDIVVCTPSWMTKELAEAKIVSGRHYLFISEYNLVTIRSFLVRYAERCHGATWRDVAEMLSRIGKWEFEN